MSQILPTLKVNLSRLCENYGILCENAGNRIVAAVVKGNAYGLGMTEVAKALFEAGCRVFFIANWQEIFGMNVPGSRVYALSGVEKEEYEIAVNAEVTPVLHRLDQVHSWLNMFPGKHFGLLLNTTLNRLGLTKAEFNTLQKDLPCLKITQMSCGYEPQYEENDTDLTLISTMDEDISDASSCAFLLQNSKGMIRAGRWLYGIPSGKSRESPIFQKIKPVATLTAVVIAVREVGPGKHIGYNRGFYAKQNMRIAILNIGYSSGYIVLPDKPQHVWFQGEFYPVVSQSMDFTTIDIGQAKCAPGDIMELFGDNVCQENRHYKIRIMGEVKQVYVKD